MLPISTFSPLRERKISRGRKALPATEFSDGGNQNAQPHFQFGIHDHLGQRQDIRRSTHVLLHDQHAAGRLQVQAARIKTDAFTDQRDFWI